MLFVPIFAVLSAVFQNFAYGGQYNENILNQKNLGLTLASNDGAGLDVAENFKLQLLTGLKAADIFDGHSSVINQNQLYVASRLLVRLLSTRFSLQLGNSYITSCYKALSAVNVNLGLDAYLAVFANFTSQLLVQQGRLVDIDVALRASCESIILACSKAFNLNIDIAIAVDIALDASVGVGAGTDIGSYHGGTVKPGGVLDDDDVSVKISKKFGCIIKSSQEFDLSVLSGDRKSVLRAIVPAIRGSLGVKAANAFAHCLGLGIDREDDADVGVPSSS